MRRSSIQLRPKSEVNLDKKRSRSLSLPKSETKEYERDRKRKQREKKKVGKEIVKKGRKETISIKTMTPEEKKAYERNRKALQRHRNLLKSKQLLSQAEPQSSKEASEPKSNEDANDEDENDDEASDVEFSINKPNEEAGAIMNMILSSPAKKKKTEKILFETLQTYCADFMDIEMLDLLVVLAQSLSPEVQDIIGTLGIEISHLAKRMKVKRKYFSDMARSTKDRHKKTLLSVMEKYNDEVSAKVFVRMLQTVVHLWVIQLDELKSCGLNVHEKAIPVRHRVAEAAAHVGKNIGDIGNTSEKDMDNKILKVSLITETIKKNPEAINRDYGCAKSLATSFGVSEKMAKKLIQEANEKSPKEIASRVKKQTIMDSNWPDLVQQFCFTKPICREAPGESVSVAYGKRSEKFIRQFSIKDIHKLFCLKYPQFNYELSTFRKLIPKNLVKPSMRDIKQNTCPLHENVRRSVKGFNRFAKKNKLKNLVLPTSTIDVCLNLICNPNIQDPEINRNPPKNQNFSKNQQFKKIKNIQKIQ